MNKTSVNGEMLSAEEIDRLATYNAERRRGLVHSDIWRREMERIQELYDAQIASMARLCHRRRAAIKK